MKFNLKIATTIFFIIAFFVVANLSLAGKEIKNFFYLISRPFQNTLWVGGEKFSDFLEMISEIKNLKAENEKLKLEISKLLIEKIRIRELEKENTTLRQALEMNLEKDFKLEIVKVVGKDIAQDSLLVDKGEREGLFTNLPVITPQKVLVGKVGEVYKNFSKVILISNKTNSLDAKVYEKDAEGLLKGQGNLQISLELLPKEKEIFPGDLVVSSSLSQLYPEGLLVGEIQEVKKQDIEPFQTAKVKPAFELGQLEYLLIISEF